MDPCYNYIVLENKCYRIDLNTAEIDIYDINENYLAINGVATKDDLIKKLNSINERNCSEDVNAIMFQSPCVNSPGFLYLGSILYRFYGKLTLHSAITRNIPEKLCPPSGDSFLSCLSTFLTNVLRYKLVSRKDRDNIICANTTYELSIDNVCFLFDKYTDFDKSFMSNMFHPNDLLKALRILNTTILSSNRKNINKTLKLCDNGNVVFNDNVFLLRRSKVGGYFLTGNIDMLFSSCNMSLPDGMRRIGIFPEFKSAESLYGFIQDITGLALKRDDLNYFEILIDNKMFGLRFKLGNKEFVLNHRLTLYYDTEPVESPILCNMRYPIAIMAKDNNKIVLCLNRTKIFYISVNDNEQYESDLYDGTKDLNDLCSFITDYVQNNVAVIPFSRSDFLVRNHTHSFVANIRRDLSGYYIRPQAEMLRLCENTLGLTKKDIIEKFGLQSNGMWPYGSEENQFKILDALNNMDMQSYDELVFDGKTLRIGHCCFSVRQSVNNKYYLIGDINRLYDYLDISSRSDFVGIISNCTGNTRTLFGIFPELDKKEFDSVMNFIIQYLSSVKKLIYIKKNEGDL